MSDAAASESSVTHVLMTSLRSADCETGAIVTACEMSHSGVCVCVCILTSAGQVPAGVFGVFSVPDGGAHRTDQCHDQQDAKQD